MTKLLVLLAALAAVGCLSSADVGDPLEKCNGKEINDTAAALVCCYPHDGDYWFTGHAECTTIPAGESATVCTSVVPDPTRHFYAAPCTPVPAEPAAPPDKPAALPPLRVYIDGGVTQQDAVRAGVDAWRAATAGVRDWVYVANGAPADVAVYEVGKYARLCDTADETDALGCASTIGGLWTHGDGGPLAVYLVSDNYEADARLTTMHEIGHLLGLTHAAGGFMAADAHGAWSCPDAEPLDILQTKLKITGLTSCPQPNGDQ